MSFFSGLVGGLAGMIPVVGPAISGAISGYEADKGVQQQNQQNQQMQQQAWSQSMAGQKDAQAFNSAEAATARQWSEDQSHWAAQWNRDEADQSRRFTQSMLDQDQSFNASEAQKNRDWQEQMANTSWQRAVGDMEKAGLNPMLAYSQGGAGSGSGAQASIGMGSSAQGSASAGASPMASSGQASGQMTRMENATAASIQSAFRGAEVSQGLQNGALQNQKLEADILKTKADTMLSGVSAGQVSAATDKINAEIDNVKKDWELKEQTRLKSMTESEYWAANAKFQSELQKAQVATELGKPGLIQAQSSLAKINALSNSLDIPRQQNEAAAQSSWFKRNVSPYLPDFGSVANGAKAAAAVIGM